jgi:hypothetical protein
MAVTLIPAGKQMSIILLLDKLMRQSKISRIYFFVLFDNIFVSPFEPWDTALDFSEKGLMYFAHTFSRLQKYPLHKSFGFKQRVHVTIDTFSNVYNLKINLGNASNCKYF